MSGLRAVLKMEICQAGFEFKIKFKKASGLYTKLALAFEDTLFFINLSDPYTSLYSRPANISSLTNIFIFHRARKWISQRNYICAGTASSRV